MTILRNPLIWLVRFRKRCGYGIHSPFAFDFVTGVLYESGMYYAYKEMDERLKWWQRFRVRSYLHLLFRLANYRQPHIIYMDMSETTGACVSADVERLYLKAGCKGVHFIDRFRDEKADMILIHEPNIAMMQNLYRDCMIVATDIGKYRDWWNMLQSDARVTVTFDLWDIGIAFCRPDLNPQNYTINW